MDDFRLYRWLDACLQPASIIAIVLLPLVWGVVFYEIAQDHRRSEEAGERRAASMARLFENHVYRTIRRSDDALVALQNSYPDVTNPEALRHWLVAASGSISAVRIGFIDAQGILRAASRGAVAPDDFSEREYFRHFLDSDRDELYAGRPLGTRLTAATAVRLARRVTRPDGSFAGVVVAALEHEFTAAFYATLDRTVHPTLALLGTDGTVRAAHGPTIASDGITIRSSLIDPKLIAAARSAQAGSYWAQPAGETAHVVA